MKLSHILAAGALTLALSSTGVVAASAADIPSLPKTPIPSATVTAPKCESPARFSQAEAKTGLNIRKSASSSSKVVGGISKGGWVKVGRASGAWVAVTKYSSVYAARANYKGVKGYVKSKYLTKVHPSVSICANDVWKVKTTSHYVGVGWFGTLKAGTPLRRANQYQFWVASKKALVYDFYNNITIR